MKEEGATDQEIEEYRKNEIIVKSIRKIRENAQAMQERRASPERYSQAESKVRTINPYAKMLSSTQKKARPDSPSKTVSASR